ncbi:hypothetical protein BY458DRAFT_432160, partial [Sporodiniella umbellata]
EEIYLYRLEMLTHLRFYCKKQGLEQKSTNEGLDVETQEIALKAKQQIKPYKATPMNRSVLCPL